MSGAPPEPVEWAGQRILFVTGKLAEPALRRVLAPLAQRHRFEPVVAVPGVQVAALLHTKLLLNRLAAVFKTAPHPVHRVVLPGSCDADPVVLGDRFGVPFHRGPADLHDLPAFFGGAGRAPPDLSRFDLEIVAEINHAARLSDREVAETAARLRADGADVIDVGATPGSPTARVPDLVRLLVGEGHRVSVDSFDRGEVEGGVAAGAELILSCNGSNLGWAKQLPVEFVVIPDEPSDLESLFRTADELADAGVPHRLDAILEPIGFGFAASLGRYLEVRRRRPDAALLMGVGNLTELTGVDSAGVNALLAGFCQEQRIGSVLTTQVIPWAQSSVRELDAARRLVRCAADRGTVPKHLGDDLVMLRDPRPRRASPEEIAELAASLTDPNYRVLIDGERLHLLNRDGHDAGRDPFALFDAAAARAAAAGRPLSAAHAFYLGHELAKASVALTLGKGYVQDEALRWGLLTEAGGQRAGTAGGGEAGEWRIGNGGWRTMNAASHSPSPIPHSPFPTSPPLVQPLEPSPPVPHALRRFADAGPVLFESVTHPGRLGRYSFLTADTAALPIGEKADPFAPVRAVLERDRCEAVAGFAAVSGRGGGAAGVRVRRAVRAAARTAGRAGVGRDRLPPDRLAAAGGLGARLGSRRGPGVGDLDGDGAGRPRGPGAGGGAVGVGSRSARRAGAGGAGA